MLNQVNLQGRLVADPEVRNAGSKKEPRSVANYRIAVDRDYTDKDGNRDTDFINCTSWAGQADFVEKYFHKGSPIIVNGRLVVRNYEDKDGNKRTACEIAVENVYFSQGSKKDEESETKRNYKKYR